MTTKNRPTSSQLRAWIRACADAGADRGDPAKMEKARQATEALRAEFPNGWGDAASAPDAPEAPEAELPIYGDDGELIPGQLYQLREDGKTGPELYCARCAELNIHHTDAVAVKAFIKNQDCVNAVDGVCE